MSTARHSRYGPGIKKSRWSSRANTEAGNRDAETEINVHSAATGAKVQPAWPALEDGLSPQSVTLPGPPLGLASVRTQFPRTRGSDFPRTPIPPADPTTGPLSASERETSSNYADRQRWDSLEFQNGKLRAHIEHMRKFQRTWPRSYPLIHFNLHDDIAEDRQRAVRIGMLAWLVAVAGYLLNWFIITMMYGADTDIDLLDWSLACVMVVLGLPLSWLLWCRSIYQSQIADSFAEYSKFFVNGSIHIAWSIFIIVSPPILVGRSCAGIANFWRISEERSHTRTALIAFNAVNIALWTASILLIANSMQMVMSSFNSKWGPRVTGQGAGGIFGRMFMNMFAQSGDVTQQFDLDALDNSTKQQHEQTDFV